MPDRAHVLRRRPPADRAAHDPRLDPRTRRPRRSRSCASPRRPTSSGSSRRWTACRSSSAVLDPPLHEFLPDVESLLVKQADGGPHATRRSKLLEAAKAWREANPMIGVRGVRLGVLKPGLYAMQVRALMEAAYERAAAGGHPVVEIMIPLTISREELALARSWVVQALGRGAPRRTRARPGAAERIEVAIGTMIETPRAALLGRRDRRGGRLLLLRDQRPHPDDLRLQPRRRRGQDDGRLPEPGPARARTRSRTSTPPASASSSASRSSAGGRRARASRSASAASTAATPPRSTSSPGPGSTT